MKPAELNELLNRCVEYHGHFCLGQILGIRIANKGIELAAIDSPKNLIVIVENDRCIADAIQIVTGARIGRRTMKLINYGKMAATFINMSNGRAFRVNIKKLNLRNSENKEAKQAVLYSDDSELLAWREIKVSFKPEDLPGKPKRTVNCIRCGEKVFDSKEVLCSDGPLCRACAQGAYYDEIEEPS